MTSPASGTRPPKPPRLPLSSQLTQMYPPRPTFTGNNVPDLTSKVYIVTGSNTGVGKEVAQILYWKNAKVYIASRSEEKAKKAINDIRKSHPSSKGELIFLHLDLADLDIVKASAEKFLSQENKLHVLFNNAAVQDLNDKDGSAKTKQGFEQHLGVNVIGVFLFTKFLTPVLLATAKSEPSNTVRVVWVSSMGTEVCGEKSIGLSLDYLNYWPALSPLERYGISKAGNWLHSVEFASRHRSDGVISIACNPGHLKSDLYRSGGVMFRTVLNLLALYPSVNGAYTELFAGFSRTITMNETGKWVAPWGRLHPIRKDLEDATKSEADGGNGYATKFWDWTENQVKEYL